MITIKSIFLLYLFTYLLSLLSGIIVGKLTKIKVTSLRDFISKLYDPITIKLKKKLHPDLQYDIKRQRKTRLFMVIFLNNLIFGAFITRTIYGLIFFYPYLLTILGGFNQGVVISKIKFMNPLLLLEFIAYLIAATAGSYIGFSLVNFFFTNCDLVSSVIISFKLYLYIIPILMIHTFMEVSMLTKIKVPDDFKIDMDKARSEILKRLDG